MVYSMRSNRAMITTKPIKKTRSKSGRHEQIKAILNAKKSPLRSDDTEKTNE